MMQGLDPTKTTSAITFSIFSPKSYSAITVQKAIQQWFMFFMTRKGSVLSDPSYGTNFFADLRKSNINDINSINTRFESEAGLVFTWLNKNTNYTDPNEIIEEANLVKYNFDSKTGILSLVIQFIMQSGNALTYTSPQTKLS